MSEEPNTVPSADDQDAHAVPRRTPDPEAIEAEVAPLSRGAVVALASPDRTGKQRRHLRGLGHTLKPTAMVGQHGLTDALADAVDAVLERHELVKVKLTEGAPCSPAATALWLHRATGGDSVQILGKTVLVYRRRKKDPEIRLPSA